jgi:hypothetical protein
MINISVKYGILADLVKTRGFREKPEVFKIILQNPRFVVQPLKNKGFGW